MKQILLVIAVVALAGCGTVPDTDPKNWKWEFGRVTPTNGPIQYAEPRPGPLEVIVKVTILEKLIADPIVEKAIREELTGKLTKADLEKVTKLDLSKNQLTDVTGLEKLTQLKMLYLRDNQLTNIKGLEKLTQLRELDLRDNPDLTKTQIDELQLALPKCSIRSNPTK